MHERVNCLWQHVLHISIKLHPTWLHLFLYFSHQFYNFHQIKELKPKCKDTDLRQWMHWVLGTGKRPGDNLSPSRTHLEMIFKGFRSNTLSQSVLVSSHHLGVFVHSLAPDSCFWITELDPAVAFCFCRLSMSRIDVLWDAFHLNMLVKNDYVWVTSISFFCVINWIN